MKLKFVLLIFSLITLSVSVFANAMPDSVGIENLNGKKVILHKLDPKDNYYSIGRRYGVKPKAIQDFNNNASLQIGHIIKVPTDRSIVETVPTAPAPVATVTKPAEQPQAKPATQQPVTQAVVTQQPVKTTIAKPQSADTTVTTQDYKVAAGETLYSIARRFNTTVGTLTTINKLNSTGLSPGQVLKVPNGATPPPPPPVVDARVDTMKRDSTYVAADSLANHRPGTNKYGLFEKNEKGAATWIDDTSLDPNKKLILHRTAPIGTVMRITNPMNNRTTFAKVVGRFTDNESTKDVIIVMTKNVAEALGALDKRFHVNISYGTPNE
ncbi:LysM peptidoglycan-binding domain-containing protein [Inquilinus sp. KBS0705]|nr:LysM peptidoglycan-binding domain-containing protein [Inquilinus sp. KBS0705]